SARGEQGALDRLEVILRVGPGESVGDVGIRASEDVRRPPGVAQDADVVGPLGKESRRVDPRPRPHRQRQRGHGEDGSEEEGSARGLSHRPRRLTRIPPNLQEKAVPYGQFAAISRTVSTWTR